MLLPTDRLIFSVPKEIAVDPSQLSCRWNDIDKYCEFELSIHSVSIPNLCTEPTELSKTNQTFFIDGLTNPKSTMKLTDLSVSIVDS